MIDAYEIGAKIILNDQIFGKVRELGEKFVLVDKAIKSINDNLKAMLAPASRVADAGNRAARAWGRVADNVERAAGAMGRAAAGGVGGGGSGGIGYPPLLLTGPRSDDGLPGTGLSSRPNWIPGADDDNRIPLGVPGAGAGYGLHGRRSGREPDYMSQFFVGGIATGLTGKAIRYGFDQAAMPAHEQAMGIAQGLTQKQAAAMAKQAREMQRSIPGIGYGEGLKIIREGYLVTRNAG
ncbi:MAG TPA: hypothetical protein VF286_00980, partial [Acidiphilium sp.]